MRSPIFRTALVAGAVLALSACSGGGDKAVNTAANEADANMALEPMNDQSATETVGNVTEPVAPSTNETGNTAETTDPGADGGETIETNTPGI